MSTENNEQLCNIIWGISYDSFEGAASFFSPFISGLFFGGCWILLFSIAVPKKKKFQAFREAKVIELELSDIRKNTQDKIQLAIPLFFIFLLVPITPLLIAEIWPDFLKAYISFEAHKSIGALLYVGCSLLSMVAPFGLACCFPLFWVANTLSPMVSRSKDEKSFSIIVYNQMMIILILAIYLVIRGTPGIFSVTVAIIMGVWMVVEGYFYWKYKKTNIDKPEDL